MFSSRRFPHLGHVALLTILPLCIMACSREPRGGPRVPTYPITGKVMVDGKPAQNVSVICHPVNGDAAVKTSISAFTDAEGQFSIGTYEGGDGAPQGEYRLTFTWGQINLMTGQYGPPDRLKGKYADPETSEFTVTAREGQEADLGVIELTTEGGQSAS